LNEEPLPQNTGIRHEITPFLNILYAVVALGQGDLKTIPPADPEID
jgi:hypothetical protein